MGTPRKYVNGLSPSDATWFRDKEQRQVDTTSRASETPHSADTPSRVRETQSPSDAHHYTGSAQSPIAKRQSHHRKQDAPSASWRTLALAAAMILLLFGNGALYWRSATQQHDLATLQSRYESDLNWLRSAEYLLINGASPVFQATLTAPDAQANGTSPAGGKAALFETAQARIYLLIQAEGLQQDAEHTVWLNHDGERQLLGEFVSTPQGTGNYVYAVDASDWPLTSPTDAFIGIRDERTQQPALTGPLVPPTPYD